MNAGTISAALSLITQRWPFPPDAEEGAKWYADRLRLAVSGWDRKREDGFRKAVDALLAAKNQYGRPSPEQIVELALARCGESARAVYDEPKPGKFQGGFTVSASERAKAATTLRAWHDKNRARMAASPMFAGSDPFAGVMREPGED